MVFLVSLVIIGAGVAFGSYVWVVAGEFDLVVWSIEEGGLSLSYMPGKGPVSITLKVDAGYIRGSRRTWVMVYPGATKRIIGAPSVPPPEHLFASAGLPLGKSDPIGLCNIYGDVGKDLKQSIVLYLQYEIGKSSEVRDALQQLFDATDYPWLTQVLDR